MDTPTLGVGWTRGLGSGGGVGRPRTVYRFSGLERALKLDLLFAESSSLKTVAVAASSSRDEPYV